MAIDIVMPALEMAQETGKLVAWLKQDGDAVKKGDPLLEVETDKAVVEVEAAADGILGGIRVKAGDVVPVGETIAWILAAGEAVPALTATPEYSARGSSSSATAEAPKPSQAQAVVAGAEPPKISPKARGLLKEHGVDAANVHRGLLKEHGVDAANVHGSGPDGTVTAEDVLAFVKTRTSPGAPAATGSTAPPSAIARLMAERTTESWTTVPHFFLSRDVDATQLLAARDSRGAAFESKYGIRFTHTDSLVKLVGLTLRNHPKINAGWVDGGVHINQHVNVSIAMAVEDGVVTAVIPDADTLPLPEIAKLRHELTLKARSGKLKPGDFANGTFTISNLGMFGIDSFCAIITPPQAAILAIGSIVDRVVAVGGAPGVKPILTLTLSVDHRVADGARGAAFPDALAKAIADPKDLLV